MQSNSTLEEVILPYEDVFPLADRVVELYAAHGVDGQTLGAFVLEKCYPDAFVELFSNGRDFYYAQRTSDARLYLVGLLRRQELDPSRIPELEAKFAATAR